MAKDKRGKKRVKQKGQKPDPVLPSHTIDNGTGVVENLISKRWLVSILLVLVSTAVYLPSLNHEFVWDEVTQIEQNAPKLEKSKLGLNLIFSEQHEVKTKKYYRPAYRASLIIDNGLWGTTRNGFQVTNILLHAGCTLLLYYLSLLLLLTFNVAKGNYIAFGASLLFALHPMHVESISFVAARGDVLAALFTMGSLYLYALSPKRVLYVLLSGLLFYLALLSKEVAFYLPFVLVGYDLITRRLDRNSILGYGVFTLIIVFYFYSRAYSTIIIPGVTSDNPQENMVLAETNYGVMEFIRIFLNSYLFYLKKLLLPYDLNPFIPYVPTSVLYSVLGFLVLAALSVTALASAFRKENITSFCVLWVLASLGPAVMVAFINIAISPLAERFLYIPSAGFCLLLSYAIVRVSGEFRRENIGYVAVVVVSLIYMFITVNGQSIWRDNITLWRSVATERSTNTITPKLNYGTELLKAGEYKAAKEQFELALSPRIAARDRGKSRAASQLSITYMLERDYPNAEKWLDRSFELDPTTGAEYYFQKASLALRKNDPASAERYLLKSVEINPYNENTYYLLSGIYMIKAGQEKSRDKYLVAEKWAKKSLDVAPYFAEAHLNLAKIYYALGDKKSSRIHAQRALDHALTEQIAKEAKIVLGLN